MNVMDRFWAKVDKTDHCWRWTAALNHAGYGHFCVNYRMVRAHRFAYEQLVGPIPEGLELDHLCRNRACVNPVHLEPVTHRENLLRGDTVTARNARATHCPQGHPYDAENTYRAPGSTRRQCRTCIARRETKEALSG